MVSWGDNDYEQANAPAGNFIRICTGYDYTCALPLDGKADAGVEITWDKQTRRTAFSLK